MTERVDLLAHFPAGFNPYTAFGSFSSQGLVHTLGTTLVIPQSFVMNATQDRRKRNRSTTSARRK